MDIQVLKALLFEIGSNVSQNNVKYGPLGNMYTLFLEL